MKRTLHGRRVLLTGASSGIGRALASQLAQAGAKLLLAARSADKLDAMAEELGKTTEVIACPTDITREVDRQRLLYTATLRWGGLDVVINNAGVASWAHFADCTEAILRQVMEVNFFAPTELMRSAIPLLLEGQQPAIVNVASMCGRKGMPAWSEYSASKFALCGLTEALRGEFARFDIDVLLILPGLTRSGLSQHLLMNKGKAKIDYDQGMPPEQVAARIVKALQKNWTETVIGSDARWMLLVNRFFPRLVDRLLARKVKQLYAS